MISKDMFVNTMNKLADLDNKMSNADDIIFKTPDDEFNEFCIYGVSNTVTPGDLLDDGEPIVLNSCNKMCDFSIDNMK